MKNIFKTLLASLLLFASCSNEDELGVTTPTTDTFYASIEAPATRTYTENGKVLWSADDQITIFKGSATPTVYQYNGETEDGNTGFGNVTPLSNDDVVFDANYAIYPHSDATSISDQGVISYTIPAVQNYAENSFGVGANPMVAVTNGIDDKFLSFKNLCGYFKFSLCGEGVTVKSIEFKGNNGEKLAGVAMITISNQNDPIFEFADDATTTLTLDCGNDGVALGANADDAKTFWFVVPATTYSEGITITITDTEGKMMTKSTSKSITIKRCVVQPLSAFKVETSIPNNQIWYTSTNGKVVDVETKLSLFGAYKESNNYNNGKGVISFKSDVTTIGQSAFEGSETLQSIEIPNSVVSIGAHAFATCSALVSVNIHDHITTIGNYAFDTCKSLTNVTIGKSVTTIGERAFYECI